MTGSGTPLLPFQISLEQTKCRRADTLSRTDGWTSPAHRGHSLTNGWPDIASTQRTFSHGQMAGHRQHTADTLSRTDGWTLPAHRGHSLTDRWLDIASTPRIPSHGQTPGHRQHTADTLSWTDGRTSPANRGRSLTDRWLYIASTPRTISHGQTPGHRQHTAVLCFLLRKGSELNTYSSSSVNKFVGTVSKCVDKEIKGRILAGNASKFGPQHFYFHLLS